MGTHNITKALLYSFPPSFKSSFSPNKAAFEILTLRMHTRSASQYHSHDYDHHIPIKKSKKVQDAQDGNHSEIYLPHHISLVDVGEACLEVVPPVKLAGFFVRAVVLPLCVRTGCTGLVLQRAGRVQRPSYVCVMEGRKVRPGTQARARWGGTTYVSRQKP